MTSVGIMAITLNYFFIKFHEANLSGRFPGAAGEGRAISAEKARKACQKRIFNFGIPVITAMIRSNEQKVEPVTNKGKPLQILVGVKDDKVNSCQRAGSVSFWNPSQILQEAKGQHKVGLVIDSWTLLKKNGKPVIS
ncbi:hypothetical protein AVEN_259160-1 [Araneus ventricosus]|uniref:Uncharacterized protein n=1 Tax=Araneus ventricosus TaxID=182803 RepID=A0A4Y2TYH9_ARAVE|nr:hypothetical protein AVEN_247344-1 [Araneus ventricosus]GBO05392.1 hypothetical protein AVEN_259160-1 [Araneus ventricosus]